MTGVPPPPANPRSTTRTLLGLLAAAGWLAVVAIAGLSVLRQFGRPLTTATFGLVALYPYLAAPIYGVVGLAYGLRRRVLLGAAALLAILHLAWVLPDLVGSGGAEASDGRAVRVLSSNLYFENTDASRIGAEIVEAAPDLLVVVELTPRHQATLRSGGFLDAFDQEYELPLRGPSGVAIYSRFPIRQPCEIVQTFSPSLVCTIDLPAGPVRLYAVHPTVPDDPSSERHWRSFYDWLEDAVSAETMPVIVAGDFNATRHHARFRSLLAGADLRDTFQVLGDGWRNTWPNARRYPPFARIDHVLVSDGLDPVRARTGRGTGSDHRPLIVDVTPST